jgi:hypothetical protein
MPATRRRKFSTRFRLIVAAEVVAAFIVAFCVLRYLRTTGRDPAFASDGEILRYLGTVVIAFVAAAIAQFLFVLAILGILKLALIVPDRGAAKRS